MKCFFCESEIENEKIKETTTVIGSKGPEKDFPINYKCKNCIHLWLTDKCAEDFRYDNLISSHRNDAGKAIRKLCESKGGRLDRPLSLLDLEELIKKYLTLSKT